MAPFKRKPATAPILTCPFSGKPLEIVKVADGLYWMARSPMFSTALYDRKESLLFDLSTRDGVEPTFPRVAKISTRDVTKPEENPIQDQIDIANAANEIAKEVGL